MMKPTGPLPAFLAVPLLGLVVAAAAAATSLPQGYPPERYEAMWKRSPFTLSSVIEEPVAGFAEQLALASILQIGDKSYVTVINKQTQKRFTLAPGMPVEGIEIVTVTNPTSPKDAVAVLRKGAETASVRFDLNLLKATAAGPPAGQTPAPGAPGTARPATNASPGQVPRPTPAGRRRVLIPSQPPPSTPPPPPKG